MAQWQACGHKSEKVRLLGLPFMAAIGMFTADNAVDQRQQFLRFRRGNAVVALFGFQTIQPLPAVDPMVQIGCITMATTPDAKGLFVPFRCTAG